MEIKKKTYGKAVVENLSQTMDDDVIEYRRSMEAGIVQTIKETVESVKEQPLYKNKNFYITLHQNVERLGQGVRSKVIARRSCPTPVYKQSVWKYHTDSASLEFLWSIPDKVLYYHIINNKAKYLSDKETAHLAQMVILMESGELEKWIQKENGEKPDVLIKINQPGLEEH